MPKHLQLISLGAFSRVALCGVVLCLAALAGCGEQNNIVEGELVDTPFAIADENPAIRMNEVDDHLMVSMSEESGNEVSMVLIQIPNLRERKLLQDIPVGNGLAADETQPWIEVSRGLKQVSYRSDGARILAMEVVDFARSLSGTVKLFETGERISGYVDIQLELGGYLEGVFTVYP